MAILPFVKNGPRTITFHATSVISSVCWRAEDRNRLDQPCLLALESHSVTMGTAEGVELGMKPADQTDRASSKAPVRIGLAGCGRLAEFGYLPAFRRASGVTLAGVADVNPHRCRLVAPEVPAFKAIHDMIQGDGMDAVIISTPTRYHLADRSE